MNGEGDGSVQSARFFQWRLVLQSCLIPAAVLVILVLIIVVGLPMTLRTFWGGSLTSVKATVFVNDVDQVGEADCEWSGGQQFIVTLPDVRAIFRVVVWDSGQQQLSALIEVRDATEIFPETLQLRMFHQRDDTESTEILVAQSRQDPLTRSSADGRVQSWLQDFPVADDLNGLPEGGLRLQWTMAYRDARGETHNISITIPLRKKEITVSSSIVQAHPNQGCELLC